MRRIIKFTASFALALAFIMGLQGISMIASPYDIMQVVPRQGPGHAVPEHTQPGHAAPVHTVPGQITDAADAPSGALREVIGHWAQDILFHSYMMGYIPISGDGVIRPDDPVTRGEFSYIMDRWLAANHDTLTALGVSYRPHLVAHFTDVPISHPFFAPISSIYGRWLIEADLPRFRPYDTVTRQEVSESITSLFRVLTESGMDDMFFRTLPVEYILSYYTDHASIADTSNLVNSRLAVAFMTRAGFIGGYPDGTFRPHSSITFAEFFSVLTEVEVNLRRMMAAISPMRPAAVPTDALRILRVDTANFTSDGFDLEITVNRAASDANAEILIANTIGATFLSSRDVELQNINRFNPLRLSHMNTVVEHTDRVVYSMRLSYAHLRNYSMFVMLRAGDRTSPVERSVVSFIGETGGGVAIGAFPGRFDRDIVLYDAIARSLGGFANMIEVTIAVNDGAVDRNAEVFIFATTDSRLAVNENIIVQHGHRRWVNTMLNTSPNPLINERTTTINVPSSGIYRVYVMLRSGTETSVYRSTENVVVGTGTLDSDIILWTINAVEPITPRNFRLRTAVNNAAAEKNAMVTWGLIHADDFTEEILENLTATNFHAVFSPHTGSFFLSQATRGTISDDNIQFDFDIVLPHSPGSEYEDIWHVFAMIQSGGFFSDVRNTTLTADGDEEPFLLRAGGYYMLLLEGAGGGKRYVAPDGARFGDITRLGRLNRNVNLPVSRYSQVIRMEPLAFGLADVAVHSLGSDDVWRNMYLMNSNAVSVAGNIITVNMAFIPASYRVGNRFYVDMGSSDMGIILGAAGPLNTFDWFMYRVSGPLGNLAGRRVQGFSHVLQGSDEGRPNLVLLTPATARFDVPNVMNTTRIFLSGNDNTLTWFEIRVINSPGVLP